MITPARLTVAARYVLAAGVYGMGFVHVPERRRDFGHRFAIGATALACSLIHRAFRREHWLGPTALAPISGTVPGLEARTPQLPIVTVKSSSVHLRLSDSLSSLRRLVRICHV
ncbi:hypothetical protein ACFRKB_26995 [Streptomyces scopuliridis]|uniref:hypothetical protein n=1 Tax=Streptomyces scopuliridis TaxID=452529 RepID=UPI00369633FC